MSYTLIDEREQKDLESCAIERITDPRYERTSELEKACDGVGEAKEVFFTTMKKVVSGASCRGTNSWRRAPL